MKYRMMNMTDITKTNTLSLYNQFPFFLVLLQMPYLNIFQHLPAIMLLLTQLVPNVGVDIIPQVTDPPRWTSLRDEGREEHAVKDLCYIFIVHHSTVT